MPSTAAEIAPQATPYLPNPREQQLLDLRRAGHSLTRIAAEANTTENYVTSAFRRLRGRGVVVPESQAMSAATRSSQPAVPKQAVAPTSPWMWTDDRKSDVRRLHAAGMTASQIAAEIGAPTRNMIIGIISRLGLKRDVVPVKAAGAPKPAVLRAPGPKIAQAPAPKPTPPKIVETLPATTEAEAAPAGAITIHELRDSRCHWPFGDPRDESFRYCGASVAPATRERGRFYCDGHVAVAVLPAKGRGR